MCKINNPIFPEVCECTLPHNYVSTEPKQESKLKVRLYLQLFVDTGGENQSRAVTQFDCRGEVVGLEVFGVAWGSRHAHNLPPHQAVYNR